ncbi:MAG: MscL family protein, partial [Erysipelotrichaceae bacterium]|nr:MscL family protein [Erysipelotrichaceae bacterium]
IGDFTGLKLLLIDKGDVETNVYLNYGQFIQNVVDFVIVAFCIFMIVKAVNKLKKPEPAPAPEAPKKSDELLALEEIVEILKEKK